MVGLRNDCNRGRGKCLQSANGGRKKWLQWCPMMFNGCQLCPMMINDVQCCSMMMMFDDAQWCSMVFNGDQLCPMMINYVQWCPMMFDDDQ
jgi:hypothetical protein